MLARWRRSVGGWGRRAMIAALVGLVLVSGVSAVALLRARPAAAAVTPYNATLLMVHGFNDTCTGAFLSTQNQGGISKGEQAETTYNYFDTRGWHDHIKLIKYYKFDDGCTDDVTSDFSGGACEQFLQVPNAPSPPYAANASGTVSDPIRHVACLLAWYIYTTFTPPGGSLGEPVVILAHSMGGLLVRDALGESGYTSGFPPFPLDVRQVVTVGTPHGGQSGGYLLLAKRLFGFNSVPREVWDMDPSGGGSGFMTMLFGDRFQAPRGLGNAQWVLMAGSVPGASALIGGIATCLTNATGTTGLDCALEGAHLNDPYPDGDGVVQADSAL
ncbi:MAG TPA: hypothetical protein VHR15_01700, partial [Ktedonobacterales bacterium]|nr:hypothetical protein [Ktedonobacterales bacterium]